MTSVSVIIPVKRSERTIALAVDALLAQDYPGRVEIILVGDVGDPTWRPIRHRIAAGEVRIIEVDTRIRGRDCNRKRNIGLAAATGDVLCLTDSDMAPGPRWIATGVALIEAGWTSVAGPMRSIDGGFWGAYVDGNPFASKTPRMARPYVYGRRTPGRRKPPITANVFLTRAVYERVGGLAEDFVHSYDDYEWFQRIADAGIETLCTPELVAAHHHRQGWRSLVWEYHKAGRGCAQFVRRHRRSRFGRNRLLALGAVLLAALGLLAQLAWVTAGGGDARAGAATAAVLAGAALALGTLSALRAHRVEGIAYPLVTLVLGAAFSWGMLTGLTAVGKRRLAAP